MFANHGMIWRDKPYGLHNESKLYITIHPLIMHNEAAALAAAQHDSH